MDKDYFVPEVCGYDPRRDICAVVPTDVIDLKEAFVNGFIPDNVVVGDTEYDGNDEPASIIGRPSNDFEAIHLLQTLKDASASKVADAS